MRSVKDLFEADALNLWETMTSHGGTAGFKIPEYQRIYDWSEENLKRLLEDCINGFYALAQPKSKESYTFLGTIILVTESSKEKEPDFDGTSLSVVDGQQRLTTLALLCCALIENLTVKFKSGDADSLLKTTKDWVEKELLLHCRNLFKCTTGHLMDFTDTYTFPRIVRHEDIRARKKSDYDYHSTVAYFLNEFAAWYKKNEKQEFRPQDSGKIPSKENRLFSNYEYIKEEIKNSLCEHSDKSRLECEFFSKKSFGVSGLRSLFEELDTFGDESSKGKAIADVVKNSESESLIKIILFSSYLTKHVVLTRVKTDDENSAFDIFDALNTTGEPLTALETFKPQVVKEGSNLQESFKNIEERLSDRFTGSEKRQKETKELLVSFALYLNGYKLPLDLRSQRRYLRSQFSNKAINEVELKRRFVKSIDNIVEFRQRYWDPEGIKKLEARPNLEADNLKILKLCLSLISDMKTSLAVPILARYYWEQERNQEKVANNLFVSAVKAITAFIVLRRSMTGSTKGIDRDFRSLMTDKPEEGECPLCVGIKHSNPLLEMDKFKRALQRKIASAAGLLESEEFDREKFKQEWINQASEVPLAKHSKPLCRFLLFAAAHYSRPDPKKPGLYKREGVKPSDEIDFLDFVKWRDSQYATVEHVAPDSNASGGWDVDIYKRPFTRHTIGNLTLLPPKENSSAGNAGWLKKKVFYRVFVAKTNEDVDQLLQEAEEAGFSFTDKTKNLLKKGSRLQMLDPISEVGDWTEEFIKARTKNTLELVWDQISPWLYE